MLDECTRFIIYPGNDINGAMNNVIGSPLLLLFETVLYSTNAPFEIFRRGPCAAVHFDTVSRIVAESG